MTDKHILIDGIDVSGCEFLITNTDKQMCRCIKSDLFGGIEFVKNAKNGICKDNPNCYYKQLKRKEQECEELTSKCSQLEEKLQKYIDRERWEIELNKKRADSFKEMRRMLYGKFVGNSLIEKRSPYGN